MEIGWWGREGCGVGMWSGDVAGSGTAEADSSTHCMAILKISKMMKVEDKCL